MMQGNESNNVFKSNLLLVYCQESYTNESLKLAQNLLSTPENAILIGISIEGVFYHQKTLVEFSSNEVGTTSELVNVITGSTKPLVFSIQNSFVSIIRCLEALPRL